MKIIDRGGQYDGHTRYWGVKDDMDVFNLVGGLRAQRRYGSLIPSGA
jgi:hypothetical protein